MAEESQTRIEQRFSTLRSEGKKGFVAYITAGDPDLASTIDTVCRLQDVGVDIVELGIPFSDPLADGKVNQEAAERALAKGCTYSGVLRTIEAIRKKTDVPLLFFSYLNPLYAHGFDKAVRQASEVGVDGFLILDLSLEEMAPYGRIMKGNHVNHVMLVTPTSPPERIRRIVKHSTGFVYCVSRAGVTGMRNKVESSAGSLVRKTRSATDLPLALGFGISSEGMARQAAQVADAVVVGSAIVKKFHESAHTSAGRASAARWVGKLVKAVKEV